jgi:hypothetical protein
LNFKYPCMRKILFLIAVLISCHCKAQDTLFTIITVKGIVVLDGDTIRCGQAVTSINRELRIKSKGDYATILTKKGYAFQMGRGKHRVKETATSQYSNIARSNSLYVHGAVTRYSEVPILLAGFHNIEKCFLYGDSLTVIARTSKEKVKKYTLSIGNLFEEKIYDTTTVSHIITIGTSNLFGNNNTIMFRVKTDETSISSKDYIIKKLSPPANLEFRYDLDCITTQDFVERELNILALCEIHELYYDQLHHLHKLWKYSQQNGIEITHPYYKRLFDAYGLRKFLPVPLTSY